MPGATTTTLSTLVRPVVANDATVLKFSNKATLAALRKIGVPDMMAAGDTAFRWKLNRSTGNSSAQVFTEGLAAPTAGSQTWVEAALSWVYFRVIVQITGHAMDAMGSHYLGEDWGGAGSLRGEIKGGMDDLEDLISTTFLGSTNNGLQIAVDATGTYAGLARATYTDFVATEEAAGGDALVHSDLQNVYEALRDNDIGVTEYAALLAPLNQLTNYANLMGAGASTALVRYIADGKAPTLDAGYSGELTFHGAPIYGIPDLTDTEIIHVTHPKQDWLIATVRPIQEKELAISDDTHKLLQISTALTPVCRNPRRQGKTTNVLA